MRIEADKLTHRHRLQLNKVKEIQPGLVMVNYTRLDMDAANKVQAKKRREG